MDESVMKVVEEVKDQLLVQVYSNREQLGVASGRDVAQKIRELLQSKEQIRMIFAAAPSQNEFLETLSQAQYIDWSRITVFHMDEYIGLPADAPQKFSRFLCDRLFDQVQPGNVHLIDSANTIDEECRRYAKLLQEGPIDIICLGIGENGHLAFNDPPVANFSDPEVIKAVPLDDVCRNQQVNDGCFPEVAAVPTHALTITIPTIMSGTFLYSMVPGSTKREAVEKTLKGPITTQCPSTILRRHAHCTLYLDVDSYGVK